MPALNFQRRFVLKILGGVKRHTIRAKRKIPIKPGDRLFLFSGMRTKQCERVANVTCSKVERIRILVDPRQVQIAWDVTPGRHNPGGVWCRDLSEFEIEKLAKADGFDSADEFFTFFKEAHGPVFQGHLIHWE